MTAAPFFPAGTIHVAVIDPGVGSARKAIAIRTRRAIFLGPDNGVLSWAVKEEDAFEIRSVENSECFLAASEQHVSWSRSLRSGGRMACGEARIFVNWDLSLRGFQRTDWPNPIRVQRAGRPR